MMEEIVNKVAASVLEVFDLEDYYPEGVRTQIDIAQWLFEGFLLREKPFREALKEHDWTQYEGHYVAIGCSTDAIIPAWAATLVAVHVMPYARKVVVGTLEDLDTALYRELLPTLDYTPYTDKPLILKGCAHKPVPEAAYVEAMRFLQPVARSIMFGEACSAVPLYKRPK